MVNREDIAYFGAGPASLPTDVLANAAAALQNFNGTGLGLAEHSHRSELAEKIVNEMKADLANFLDIPDSYDVLIMQGGGSGQFAATAYNMSSVWIEKRRQKIIKELGAGGKEVSDDEVLKELKKAVDADLRLDYVVTGSWSLKASQEAARTLGPEYVNVASDSRKFNDGKFGKIAEESTWTLSKKPSMVYLCENETVDGVEFPSFPKILEPTGSEDDAFIVGDFSSTILSRRIPIENFSVIFFGAQKNLGSTGITVVIVKKSLLSPCSPAILRKLGIAVVPTILDYSVIAKNNSLYNTLSIFDVYIAGQVLKRSLATFPDKVDGQQKVAERKAKLLYETLDAYPDIYKIVPDKAARSRMNLCFRVTKGGNIDEAEKSFLKGSVEKGLTGLKGHRSVGGIRASNYNAISEESVQKLAAYLKEFATA